jgi:phage portal protein BeeE
MVKKKEEPDIITAVVGEGKEKEVKHIFVLTPTTAKGGRPSYKLTEDGIHLAQYLASLNCTKEEIAAAMNVAPKTLENKHNEAIFAEIYKKGKELYKLNIRKAQNRIMANNNAAMAMFLGKNALGQTDASKIELTSKDPKDMTIEELHELLIKKKES